MNNDFIAKFPPAVKLLLAGLLSKLSKEQQTELFNDVQLLFMSIDDNNGYEVIRILKKYNIDQIYRNNFK